MGGNLEELSRDLSFSTNQHSPEEFIRKTLLAHGFFNHARDTREGSAVEKGADLSKVGKQPAAGISEEDRRRTTQLISHYREGKEVHTLKEPRSLFNHPSKQQTQKKLPLWPSEVECIPQRPRFLQTTPPSPEPFCHPEREVVSPKIRSGEGGGSVVYCNTPGPEKYFTRARAGPSRDIRTTPTCPTHGTTLVFESRFESGNLAKAVQVGRWDYELYLRFDLYTHKHTQWFYFSVASMRQGQTYRFTIVNLYKAGSLYNEGMQPVFYSEINARQRGVAWRRTGHNIKYFRTPLRRQDTKQESYYYGLTWSYTFQNAGDTCYFAHCYPYTYSDLQDYLHGLMSDQRTTNFCKQRTLCHTIAGNPVPILTITSHMHSPEESKAKRAVVVTARVHPGETNGSWMMKGLLDFLTGPSPDASILRDTFVFKIVPMLNPDGVIVGNYRCSLAGRDLNRNYRTKLKEAYPTIWHTKAMVKRLVGEREVVVYCDLHGHSKRQNVFIYGCDDLSDPAFRLRARVFPYMLSKNAPSKFSYRDSKFGVQKSKEGTGRVVMWREMGVRNSYTMESTFCGSLLGQQTGLQFSTADLEAMGYCFCDTLLDYCDPDQTKVEHILHHLEEELRQSILAQLVRMGREVPPGVDLLDLSVDCDLVSDSSDGGSDSSESDGPPVHLMKGKKKKHKKLKSRNERNKHKALLKLTHGKAQGEPHPPPSSTQLPPPSTHITERPTQNPPLSSVPHPPLTDPTPFRYSPIDTARNGGMPMFIQERLEERQRRRNDLEPSGGLSDEQEYVELVAMSYLQQGLPHSSLQDTSAQDPRSSTPFLPHPSCPISIAQMNLREKPANRASSKTSLPQLLLPPPPLPLESLSHALLSSAAGSHAVFASRYVANHLQDVITDPPGGVPSSTSVAASNNTRNLANLSRLFRQLKPHLAQSIAKESRVPFRSPSKPELQGQLQPNGEKGEEVEKPTKVEFLSVDKGDTKIPQRGPGENFPQGSSLHSLSKHLEQVALKRNEVRRPTTPSRQSRSPKLSKGDKDLIQKLTWQDKNAVADGRSSHSSLGHSSLGHSSPVTSSWESFTRPAPLTGRAKEAEDKGTNKEEREQVGVELKRPPTASIGAELPDKQPQGRADRYEALMRAVSEGRRKQPPARPQPIPKSYSSPDQTSTTQQRVPPEAAELSSERSGDPRAASVRSHKKGIAAAVQSMQERRKLFREPAETSEPDRGRRVGSHPVAAAQTRPQTCDTGQTSYPAGVRRSHSDWGPSTKSPAIPPPPSSSELPLSPRQLTRSAEGLSSNKSVTLDSYVPVPSSHVFSSKPPSRYGRRPTAGDGVPPATVSLMLSGRTKPRPSTMHGSRSRKPRNLTVRYFSKKSSLFHID